MDPSIAARTPELPVACTLDATDGAARMVRWRRLVESAHAAASRRDSVLEVRFDPGAEVASELAALSTAERDCCAFLDWSVDITKQANILRVTTDAASPDDVEAVAVLFGVT